jgi:hypothetical protein
MSKHTPGPWMVTNGIDIWPDDGDMRGLRHIAMCHPLHGYPELEDHLEWDERIANARLIAAAPELLEALGCDDLRHLVPCQL